MADTKGARPLKQRPSCGSPCAVACARGMAGMRQCAFLYTYNACVRLIRSGLLYFSLARTLARLPSYSPMSISSWLYSLFLSFSLASYLAARAVSSVFYPFPLPGVRARTPLSRLLHIMCAHELPGLGQRRRTLAKCPIH